MHCRLSALGHVVGGAETVVRALLDAVGAGGTIVAYTGWQDAPPDDIDALSEEERRAYLEEQPVYDPRVALSCRDHGRVPELLRTWPRSLAETLVGPLAEHDRATGSQLVDTHRSFLSAPISRTGRRLSIPTRHTAEWLSI